MKAASTRDEWNARVGSAIRYAPILFLLLGTFACLGLGQTLPATDSGNQNVRDCLDGFATCNRSLLTEAQASEIAELKYDENLRGCLTGYYPCDVTSLTARDAEKVAQVQRRRNLLACEINLESCDKALLSPLEVTEVKSELAQVQVLKREHNLLACQIGDPSCDGSLLTPFQLNEVSSVAYQINFLACKTGQGFCEDSLLKPGDRRLVAEALARRNALSGYAEDEMSRHATSTATTDWEAETERAVGRTGQQSGGASHASASAHRRHDEAGAERVRIGD